MQDSAEDPFETTRTQLGLGREDPIPDPYEALSISIGASPAVVKSAFRRESVRYHPDKFSPDLSESERKKMLRKFHVLSWAKDFLIHDDYSEERGVWILMQVNGVVPEDSDANPSSSVDSASSESARTNHRGELCDLVFNAAFLLLQCSLNHHLVIRQEEEEEG